MWGSDSCRNTRQMRKAVADHLVYTGATPEKARRILGPIREEDYRPKDENKIPISR